MTEQMHTIEERNAKSLNTLIRAITLSQSQFALILVRCNYAQVCDRITHELQARLPFAVDVFTLPESAKTLYTTIHAAVENGNGKHSQPASNSPQALMIFGLESLQDLDQALIATNIVREELRKQFQFPLVLWVNDEVLKRLERIAPDLFSWAGNTILEFEMEIPDLVRSLRDHSNRLFNSILSLGDEQFWARWQLTSDATILRPHELKFAINDLQASQYEIDPELQANLDFLMGQMAHSEGQMSTAKKLYERSLAFWLQHLNQKDDSSQGDDRLEDPTTQAALPAGFASETAFPPKGEPSATSNSPYPLPPIPYLERAACLFFYLGLLWRSYAVMQPAAYKAACRQAYYHFQRSLELFSQENREDLVARFITAQAETLQKLREWDKLETLAKEALVLHQLYKDPTRQARDRGFLAEVALARSQWQTAKEQVERSLQILADLETDLNESSDIVIPHLETSLEVAHRYHYGWYLFLLAKAEKKLGNLDTAIAHLEAARDHSHPQSDPLLYIQILRSLRNAYFAKGDYQLAFRTRQARRLIEHQYGYRAFVGALRLQPQQTANGVPLPLPEQINQQQLLAQEIKASGRQKDLNALIARLSQAQYKLIVLHGHSGVGKSSIVTAGLIPLLQEQTFDGRLPLPLLIDYYSDWQGAFQRVLDRAWRSHPLTAETLEPLESEEIANEKRQDEAIADKTTDSLSDRQEIVPFENLIHQLEAATNHNLLPILLLDQFEEFFFAYETVRDRIPFYRFLGQCLNLPFVKVVLSLREDYLHKLLELQRYADLDIINNDILGKDIRYPLQNLTPEDAQAVIKSLTDKAHLNLPEDLITELVRDLAGELGEVRPIELQVVGAQLQAEGIKTLEDYYHKGPKERLVERSLEDVVKDCGPENEDLARIVLFLLTNEDGSRPLKTRDDLEADLVDLGLTQAIAHLDLVLEVLVGSGLVFLIPDSPADFYQLVHDYLVSFIRQKQVAPIAYLKAELNKERQERFSLEKDLAELRSERMRIKSEVQKLTSTLKEGFDELLKASPLKKS